METRGGGGAFKGQVKVVFIHLKRLPMFSREFKDSFVNSSASSPCHKMQHAIQPGSLCSVCLAVRLGGQTPQGQI